MGLNQEALVAKLNASCKSALAGAVRVARARHHYEVDLEHLLLRLSETTDSDVAQVYRYFGIDAATAMKALTESLDRMSRGNARDPMPSPRLKQLLSDAWMMSSVEFGETMVRSGFLILALLANEALAQYVLKSCPELEKISVEELKVKLITICTGSSEDLSELIGKKSSVKQEKSGQEKPAAQGKSNLDQFTVDMTAEARAGRIDPVLERDMEVRQIVDILTRRRQNNPILTGEAGVGKTAVVEGFALRIANGDVPPSLKDVQLRSLDLALLQAGASMKGEFENRLKSVINEVKMSPVPVILFIDEAHTMIGAGGTAGTSDAANLLKPALARGELRTIAATTWSEYKKYFEKDAALARRFQVVKVEEPNEEQACTMLRGVKATLENHHNVVILDEAMTAAVRLSQRYIIGRHLPDKAVSVLDTACARVALAQNATPAALEDSLRRIDALETEIRVLEREAASGAEHHERLKTLTEERDASLGRAAELTGRLERERNLVSKVIALRKQIEELVLANGPCEKMAQYKNAPPDVTNELAETRRELKHVKEELAAEQGELPMVHPYVDSEIVAEVIAGWTGIPVGKMLKDEIETVLKLEKLLGKRVIGQDHALAVISQRIHTARAGLDDPRRPVGVFLLVGPSGVGKTETALALADTLYGGERNLVVINMSEYQEPHSVAGLKGSPPGYVGYGEGGVLTEAIRRKPYCVLLLDEMEKAHIDVMELFYQVFDKGFMEDAEGREVDFKNAVIIMTSNAASDQLMAMCMNGAELPEPGMLVEAIGPRLRQIFKPALLGRLVTVPYYPIGDASLCRIIRLKLDHIGRRVEETYGASFDYSDELVEEVAERCTEVESGARTIDHILTGTLLPEISTKVLGRLLGGEPVRTISVRVEPGHGFLYEVS
jgi:type VI secretion system protein VasG